MSTTASKWYVIQTEPRSELEVSRYLSRLMKSEGVQRARYVPSPRVIRTRRHVSSPYIGCVFMSAELTDELIETIEAYPAVRGFVRESETYLIEFEGYQGPERQSVDEAIRTLNMLGQGQQISEGFAPFILSNAKRYEPATRGIERLTQHYHDHEGCDFPSTSDFIEVKMRFSEYHRTLIRDISGVVDIVGGSKPLIKKGYGIQDAELKPLMLKDNAIDRFKTHKHQLYVLQTHSQFESHVINALNHHRASDEEALFKGEIAHLFINSARFVASEEESSTGEVKKKFTGYIYISMHMSIDSWHLVKSIPKVSGFVGGKNIEEVRPVSMSEGFTLSQPRTREVEHSHQVDLTFEFAPGDIVGIIDGPFANYLGEIQEVYAAQERIRLLIDPNRSLSQRDPKERARFSNDLNFSAEVEFKQVKKLD